MLIRRLCAFFKEASQTRIIGKKLLNLHPQVNPGKKLFVVPNSSTKRIAFRKVNTVAFLFLLTF